MKKNKISFNYESLWKNSTRLNCRTPNPMPSQTIKESSKDVVNFQNRSDASEG